MMKNGKKTRKTHRPDFDIKYPSDPCIEFLKEKKFCELEEQIAAEKAKRIADRRFNGHGCLPWDDESGGVP